jgi:hypothetical protein
MNIKKEIKNLRKITADRKSGKVFLQFNKKKTEGIDSELPELVIESFLEKVNTLGDIVLGYALSYTKNNFHQMDDFWVYSKRRNIRINVDRVKSYDKFLSLTEKDFYRGNYLDLYSRIISVALSMKNVKDINGYHERLTGRIKSRVNSRNYVVTSKSGIYRYEKEYGGSYVWDPFVCDRSLNFKKMQEIFFSILLKFGSPEDLAKVVGDYSHYASAKDLMNKIDEAAFNKDAETANTLFSVFTKNEPMHPELPRLKDLIDRLGMIERLRASENIDVDSIEGMSGEAFEDLILAKFKKLNFDVESTPRTGDFGSDLIVTTENGTRISVQCKRFKAKVNLKAVQEVLGSLGHYDCDYGLVVTNNTFLKSAINLANNNDIELWDREKLINFLGGDISFSGISDL